jgi:hypothetical protein
MTWLIGFTMLLRGTNSFGPIPVVGVGLLHSLQVALTSPDYTKEVIVINADVAQALDALRQAAVPMSVDTAISITIAEFLAGVVGGGISRATADLLGDKKKDSFQTKVSTTGAYFGTRAAVRTLARIAGLPRPLALLCSSVVASLVSETTKSIARTNRAVELDPSCPIEEQGLRVSEISGDISKWLIFDFLEEKVRNVYSADGEFVELVLATFLVGCASAAAATSLKMFIEMRNPVGKTGLAEGSSSSNGISFNGAQYAAAAGEGGVLFASFQIVLKVVMMIVPSDFNKNFMFNSFIKEIEQQLAPEVVSLF